MHEFSAGYELVDLGDPRRRGRVDFGRLDDWALIHSYLYYCPLSRDPRTQTPILGGSPLAYYVEERA
jgi:hypothetical protein